MDVTDWQLFGTAQGMSTIDDTGVSWAHANNCTWNIKQRPAASQFMSAGQAPLRVRFFSCVRLLP